MNFLGILDKFQEILEECQGVSGYFKGISEINRSFTIQGAFKDVLDSFTTLSSEHPWWCQGSSGGFQKRLLD